MPRHRTLRASPEAPPLPARAVRRRASRSLSAAMLAAVSGVATACSFGDAIGAPRLDSLPEIQLEEQVRIGSLDDPEVGFTQIGNVWISPTNEVYVADTRELEVRAYSADGRLIQTFGRPGDGPGEFQSIWWFGVVRDTLWVSDAGPNRITGFTMDGRVAATVTGLVEMPFRGGEMERGRPLSVRVFPHEMREDGLIESSFNRTIRPNLPDSMVDVPRVLFDRNGQVVDTLEMIPTLVSRRAQVLAFGNVRTFVYPDPPALDSGTYELPLDSGSFSVHWLVDGDPPVGTLVAIRHGPEGANATTLAYDPKRVTAEYHDSIARSRVGGGRTRSDSLEVYEAQRAAIQLPPHHRPLTSFTLFGEDFWSRLDPHDPSTNRWIVFRGDGDLAGIVSLPARAFPRWSNGDQVWIVERDDFDVPWLVRYRMVIPEPTAPAAG